MKKKGETLSNQVTNFISFGNEPEQVAAFHKMLRELRQEDGVYGSLDFNKLIPMPEPLNIESGTWTNQGLQAYRSFMTGRKNAETFKKEHPDAWELGRQAYENIQKYGYPTWFEWRIQHWGTRCNAYSCVELRQGDQTMRFETAWRRVLEIVRALSKKYPDQTVTYRWADAELGADVGEAVFQNGKIADVHIPKPHSKEAHQLAQDIMKNDLAHFNPNLSKGKKSRGCRAEAPKERVHSKNKRER